jgi:hypothetical protein
MKKRNYLYLTIGIILMLAGGTFLYLYYNTPELKYPYYATTYDFQTVHMYHAKNILTQKPDCYADQPDGYYDRLFWCVESNLLFYKQTDDITYLDRAVSAVDKITQASRFYDSNADGIKDLQGYYPNSANGLYASGYLTQLTTDTWLTIKENKIEKYQDRLPKYEEVITEYIKYFKARWKSYDSNNIELGYYLGSPSDTTAIPYNQGATATVAMYRYGKATNNAELKEIMRRYLNRFFTLNEVQNYQGTDFLACKYYLYDVNSGETKGATYEGYTDMSHLNLEFELILTGWEENYVSTDKYNLITNALKVMESKGKIDNRETPLFYQSMQPPRKLWSDETGRNIFEQTGHIPNMIRFGATDQVLLKDMEEVLRNLELDGQLQGNYYTDLYKCVYLPNSMVVGQETTAGYFIKPFCSSGDTARIENMEILYGIANLGRTQDKPSVLFNMSYLTIGLILIGLSVILIIVWWYL